MRRVRLAGQPGRFGIWAAPARGVGPKTYAGGEIVSADRYTEPDSFANGEGTAHFSLRTDRELLMEFNGQQGYATDLDPHPTVDRAVADASALEWIFTCYDTCTSNRWEWIYGRISQATMTLRDDINPAGSVSGSAVGASI